MTKLFLVNIVLFILFDRSYGEIDIEKYLKICDRNSPDTNDCLVDAVQEGLNNLSDGISELDVPPIDPYVQKEIRVDYKNNQEPTASIYCRGGSLLLGCGYKRGGWFDDKPARKTRLVMQTHFVTALFRRHSVIDPIYGLCRAAYHQVAVKMIMKNIVVTGLKTAKVHDVRLKADDDRFYMEVDVTSPKVFVNGQYHGEGSYTSLNIRTDGEFNTTMTELVYTWKLEGTPKIQNGTTYMKITSFYMRPDVGGFRSYISNVVPDNPELTKVANDFANRNWRILYREMLPYAQANWNKIGIRVANKIFLKVPYDRLFPAKN